jgi:ankyrin repeat protein
MAQCGAFVGTMMDKTDQYLFYLSGKLIPPIGNKRGLLLIKAIKENNSKKAKSLIEQGTNINIQDDDGCTPLYWAVRYNVTDIVDLLLKKGANIEVQDKYGLTPLHYAVQERLTEIVNLLLDHNAQTDTKSNNGSTPLHRATVVMNEADRTPEGIQTRQEIIHSLLNQGADINARDGFGCTPLHYAVQYLNQEAIVLLLLERDAKIDIKNNEGKTPLGLAKIEYDLKKLLDIAKKQESPDVIRIKNDLIPG